MDFTLEQINRYFKLGIAATDVTYGPLSVGSSLQSLNNMGTDTRPPFDTPDGFYVSSVLDDSTTGFRMGMFTNSDTHEILVVPNGTDGWTAKDWAGNGLYVGLNQWQNNANGVIENLRKLVNADENATINIMGHSLGGALAQYTLVELLQERQKPTYSVKLPDGTFEERSNPLYQFPLDRISLETFASPGVMDVLASKYPDLNLKQLGIDSVAVRHYTMQDELVNQIGGGMVGGDGMEYYLPGNGSTDINYTHRLTNGFYDSYTLLNGDVSMLNPLTRKTLSTTNLLAIGGAVASIGGDNTLNGTEGMVRLGVALIVGAALDMTGELVSLVKAAGTPYIGEGLSSLLGVGAEVLMKALLITNPVAWAEAVIGGVIGANLFHIGASTPTPDELANLGFSALRDGFTRTITTLDDGNGKTLQVVTDQAPGIIYYQVLNQDGQMWKSVISPAGETMQMMDKGSLNTVQWEVVWPVDKPYAKLYYKGESVGNVYPDQLQGIKAGDQDMTIMLKHADTTAELKFTTPPNGTGAIGIYVNGEAALYDANLKTFSFSWDGVTQERYSSWQKGVTITDMLSDDSTLLHNFDKNNIDLSAPLFYQRSTDIFGNIIGDEEKSLFIDNKGSYSIKTTTRSFNGTTLTERIEKSYTEEALASGETHIHKVETVYFSSSYPNANIVTDTVGNTTIQTVTATINNQKVVLQYQSINGSEPDLVDVTINDKAPTDQDAALIEIACTNLTPDDFKKASTFQNADLSNAIHDYTDTTTTVWQDFMNGVTTTTQTIEKYGPSIIDALSLVKAIQSGEPLPIVASGLRVANDIYNFNNVKPNANLTGATNVAAGVLSIMSLDAALKSGDGWAIASSAANTINFAATAYAQFVTGTVATNTTELATQFSDAFGSTVGSELTTLNTALPYLNLAVAIAKGDEVGIAVAAVSIVVPAVGIAYAVYSMIDSLFGGGDDIPDPWGTGRYVWNGTGITYQSAGETGGNEAVSGVMQSVLNAMNSLIEQQRQTNPTSSLGIIPQRMPTVGYDMSGYRYTDIDPLTGVERHPSLRFDTSGNPYNATPGSAESYRSIGEAIIMSALERQAIAPMWEVQTAKMQTDAGDPKAGLTEEARAGRDGQLAAAVTGDTQVFRPVTLDLSGNGQIDIVSKATSGVSFDVDDSGYLKETAWVGGGDAFLTLDRDYNGETNSGREMFSNSTVAVGRRGLAGMGWVDANYDGKITAADPVWKELRVWKDANGDGVEAESESLTLDELGITELNYAMGTFTQNGVKKLLSSPNLEADTAGVKVNVVPEGILIDSTKDGLSLLVSRIDDMTAVQANQDGISGYEDVELIVNSTNLLANDTLGGFTGRDLTLTGVSNFRHGNGYVDANGFVHFRPEANYYGSDAGFDYTSTATANGQSGTGNVVVTLQNVNDAPSGANVIYNKTANNMQTGAGTIIGIDIDNTPDSLRYEISGNPQYGAVTVSANGAFQYTAWSSPGVPVDYYDASSPTLTDAFDVKITDPSGASYVKTVYVDHYGDYTPPTPPGGGGGKKPIAVDLNGDGFDFVNVNDSNVFFDVTGDGWKRRTAWVSPSDGLLAFDSDGNGKIEKAGEISFVGYKDGAQSDLEGLSAFDTNGDGVFSALDDKWSKFGIWQDINQNGITDEGEFKSLIEMGVTAIALTSDGQFSVVNDQTVHGVGSMQMEDGSSMAIADVTLQYSNETQVPSSDGTVSTVTSSPFSPDGEVINGTEDKDLILGKNGNNIINAFGGDDVIFEDGGNDVIDAGEGNDIVYAGADNDIVFGQGGDDMIYGGLGDDMIFGGDGHDAIFADGGNDVVFGGDGNDLISGGDGNDVLSGDNGNDQLYGEGGNDALFGRDGNDQLFGLDGYDQLNGGNGDDLLDGGANADEMIGGVGNDTYVVDDAGDIVTEAADEGTDTVIASIDYILADTLENLTLSGSDNLVGIGNDVDNQLIGNVGDNVLIGNGGNDTLNGGMGADTMKGGTGDDTYIVDNVDDSVVEYANEGIDTVRASVSYTLSNNVEDLTLTGSTSIDATGNALDNTLTGNSGNNVLDGQAGVDTMIGGKGDDVYVVDSADDVIVEYANEGIDTIRSSVTRILEETVENLVLTGDASIDATGNTMSNILIGNSAANVLDGKAGADAMAGYAGDDTYLVDNIGDTVYEAADEGDDHVISSVTYTLSDNVERLTLVGTNAIDGIGNNLNNALIGNDSNNVIDGKAGADTMVGGAGDDTYIVDNAGDVVIEVFNEGIDTIYSGVSYVLPENVENLILTGLDNTSATGNTLDNILVGNAGNNVIDGGTGVDTMRGGAGDDLYYVDSIYDTVIENIDEGYETIRSSVTYTASANVERLELLGTDDIDAYGNELNNVLVGNSGNNVLNGQSGADAMSGGAGDDTYIVDNIGDTVVEALNEGDDLVLSSVTYTLSDNVERLTLTGSDMINGTGNDLNNTLIGNGANNVLDGKAGADTMIGGAGDDTYIVDNAGDVVIEAFNEGIDTIYSSVSYVLPENVENLILTGADNIDGIGNDLDNILIGNNANNTLVGGLGNDILIGGLGDDTYIINMNDGLDSIADEGGIDTVQFTDGFSLENIALRVVNVGGILTAQVRVLNEGGCEQADQGFNFTITKDKQGNYVSPIENFTFSDGSRKTFDDLLIKTQVTYASHHQITITTGRNDDIIYGNSRNNIIYSGTGNDIVYAGSGGDKVYGQGGNDILYGNTGNDMFDGGCGTDILFGGNGNDKLVDMLGNNALLGGSQNDTIIAGNGNDFIAGGKQDDILNGGGGYNVFAFNRGDGRDTILPAAGAHNTLSLNDVDMRDVFLRKNGSDLIVSIGCDSQVTLKSWYESEANQNFDTLQIVSSKLNYSFNKHGWTAKETAQVETFDFKALVDAFDAAKASYSRLNAWSAMDTMLHEHLSTSDSRALGGDLAFSYAKEGDLSRITVGVAQTALNNPNFGNVAQTLTPSTQISCHL